MPHWIDQAWPLPPASSSNTSNASATATPSHWQACPGCHKHEHVQQWAQQLWVCKHCGHHQRMSSKTWFKHLFPNCPEKRIGDEVRAKDVLGFVDTQPYPKRLKKAAQKTGESESLWCSEAKMGHLDVVAALFEFGFMGGSLGTAAGTRFCLGVDRAIEKQCPFICVTASGGARMQEGVAALFQMAKTVQALSLCRPHLRSSRAPRLQGVTIPQGVTDIATDAFQHCTSLASITLPSSVTYIHPYTFSGCTALESITISTSVTHIMIGAFNDCLNLREIRVQARSDTNISHIVQIQAGSQADFLHVKNLLPQQLQAQCIFLAYDNTTFNPLALFSHLDDTISNRLALFSHLDETTSNRLALFSHLSVALLSIYLGHSTLLRS